MKGRIQVLIVEDLPTDAELNKREVIRVLPQSEFRVVETREEFLEALESFRPDLILSDFKLPQFDGIIALQLAKEHAPDIPFIIVTGSMNEDTAVDCMKEGAWDYIIKEHIKRLGPAVLNSLQQKTLRLERKLAEAALQRNETRFRNIAESMSDWIWEIDADGVYTYCSGNFLATLCYQKGEIIGKTPFDFMPADEANRVRAVFNEIFKVKKAFHDLENWNLSKDGRRVCMRTSGVPIFDNAGDFLGYRGVDSDITQRKQMEESLCESENKFRVLTEKAVVGVYLAQKGVLQYINPKFAEIVGYEMDELIMRKPKDFITPEDQPRAREYSRKLTSGEAESLHYELRMVKKSGDVVSVESYGSRIMYNGQPAVIGTIIDITDRKRAEKERRHREKLESALEITGAVCHEMNQPMQIISGYSELLLQTVSENDQIYMKIDRINRQIKRMAAITRKLRAINNYKTRDYAGNIRIMDINESSDDDIKTKI